MFCRIESFVFFLKYVVSEPGISPLRNVAKLSEKKYALIFTWDLKNNRSLGRIGIKTHDTLDVMSKSGQFEKKKIYIMAPQISTSLINWVWILIQASSHNLPGEKFTAGRVSLRR